VLSLAASWTLLSRLGEAMSPSLVRRQVVHLIATAAVLVADRRYVKAIAEALGPYVPPAR
jgi:hypothetical protein